MNATGIPIWYIFNESDMCSPDQPEHILIKTVDMDHSIAYVPERNTKGSAIKIDDRVYVDVSLLRKLARKGRVIKPDMIMYLCEQIEKKVAE